MMKGSPLTFIVDPDTEPVKSQARTRTIQLAGGVQEWLGLRCYTWCDSVLEPIINRRIRHNNSHGAREW